METKKCSVCGEIKSVEDFNFKKKIKNIRHSACSICWKEIRKKTYEKHKSAAKERNDRTKARNVKWFNEYKKKLECIQCGENDIACLDFHHLERESKEHSVSMLVNHTSSIKKIQDEISKCIVLCSNCHRKLHYYENR